MLFHRHADGTDAPTAARVIGFVLRGGHPSQSRTAASEDKQAYRVAILLIAVSIVVLPMSGMGSWSSA